MDRRSLVVVPQRTDRHAAERASCWNPMAKPWRALWWWARSCPTDAFSGALLPAARARELRFYRVLDTWGRSGRGCHKLNSTSRVSLP